MLSWWDSRHLKNMLHVYKQLFHKASSSWGLAWLILERFSCIGARVQTDELHQEPWENRGETLDS